MRKRPDPYRRVIDEYQPVITKDQLYKICHISKRTASHLLENGLIPCQCSGKKTRKYKIAIADVVKSIAEVSDITGCSSTAITRCCNRKYLHNYFIRRKFYIPKLSLLDFFQTEHFVGIQEKSKIHLAYLEVQKQC